MRVLLTASEEESLIKVGFQRIHSGNEQTRMLGKVYSGIVYEEYEMYRTGSVMGSFVAERRLSFNKNNLRRLLQEVKDVHKRAMSLRRVQVGKIHYLHSFDKNLIKDKWDAPFYEGKIDDISIELLRLLTPVEDKYKDFFRITRDMNYYEKNNPGGISFMACRGKEETAIFGEIVRLHSNIYRSFVEFDLLTDEGHSRYERRPGRLPEDHVRVLKVFDYFRSKFEKIQTEISRKERDFRGEIPMEKILQLAKKHSIPREIVSDIGRKGGGVYRTAINNTKAYFKGRIPPSEVEKIIKSSPYKIESS